MRRYLSALAVALVALSGAARVMAVNQHTLAVVVGYDLDSELTFVYPIALGPTSVPSTAVRPQAAEGWYETVSQQSGSTVDRRIKTADYDPTVVSCVTSSSALESVDVGDLIQVNDKYNRPLYAGIFSKASAESVEFDRAVELTQSGCAKYKYRKITAGSELYDGWFSVAGWGYTTIYIDVAQLVGDVGIDVQVECMTAHGLSPSTVMSSTGIDSSLALALLEPWEMCRVGMRWANEADDNDNTPATDNEIISVYAIRRDH